MESSREMAWVQERKETKNGRKKIVKKGGGREEKGKEKEAKKEEKKTAKKKMDKNGQKKDEIKICEQITRKYSNSFMQPGIPNTLRMRRPLIVKRGVRSQARNPLLVLAHSPHQNRATSYMVRATQATGTRY